MLVTNKLRSILSPVSGWCFTCDMWGHMTSSHGGGLHWHSLGGDKETTWDMWHFVMTLAVNFSQIYKCGKIRPKYPLQKHDLGLKLAISWQHIDMIIRWANWYSWDHDVLLHPDVFLLRLSSAHCPRPTHTTAKWWRIWDAGVITVLCIQITASLPSSSLILAIRPHYVFTP